MIYYSVASPYSKDEETGLYYYGARYLNPQTSRRLSTDPAMGEYIPQAPVSEEARRCNGNLPGMGGVFNVVNLHVYHYAGNNPVKYTDPDGRKVFMIGVTGTTGAAGTGETYEVGIAISVDKNGQWEVGTYQVSGFGFMVAVGTASITVTGSLAPFAQKIKDITGRTETVGASGTPFVVFAFGGDVNIPIDGPIKNFSFSFHAGVSAPGTEAHALTTSVTAQVFGKGSTFKEAWDGAIAAGMIAELPENMLEHFKKAYVDLQLFEDFTLE
jgi:hypothetical protein